MNEQDWVRHLVTWISGKARATYNEVDAQAEYPVVKETILNRLEVTPDMSLVKMRRMRFWLSNDIGDYMTRVKTLV